MRSPPERKSSNIPSNTQRSRKLKVYTDEQQQLNCLITILKDDLQMSASENVNKIAKAEDTNTSKVLPPVMKT